MLDSGFPVGKDGFPFKDATSNGGGSGPVLLATGVYWKSGLSSSPPHEGQGWTSGLPGLSSGASITVIRVLAVALAPTAITSTIRYKGDLVDGYLSWSGTTWDIQGGLFPSWLTHGLYTPTTNAFGPTAPPSRSIWMGRYTESDTSGGNVQSDAFTVI